MPHQILDMTVGIAHTYNLWSYRKRTEGPRLVVYGQVRRFLVILLEHF